MPHVTLRLTIHGVEETLFEYLCDWPDCPNIAVRAVCATAGLRLLAAFCEEHAPRVAERPTTSSN